MKKYHQEMCAEQKEYLSLEYSCQTEEICVFYICHPQLQVQCGKNIVQMHLLSDNTHIWLTATVHSRQV